MSAPAFYTPDWAITQAARAAKGYLRRAPRAAWDLPRWHWIGVAWERIDREAGRGTFPADEPGAVRLAVRVGSLACVDELRVATGYIRKTRAVRLPAALPLSQDVAAPETADAPDRRLLALWCETRPQRAGLDWRSRVWVYLWLVEGW